MANNFGLYTVNAGTELVDPTYNLNTGWERYALKRNGRTIFKTSLEDTPKHGVVIENNTLPLDDEVIAINNSSEDNKVESSHSVAKFGNIVLHGTDCIKITKEDYQKLRSGEQVDGYARYSTESVYYITDDVENCPDIQYDPTLIEGHEDIVYNSFIPGDLHEYSATEETMMSVETPTLAMRHFEATLVQGDTLDLEFFVDTYNYDSIYKGIVDDTFTIYITDENGDDLYYYEDGEGHKHHHTVYAGQFKVKLNVGDTIGKHWFRICCVDNHGRGSIEYHYDYRITSATPRIKELTAIDLLYFGLTPSNGNGISYADGMRNKVNFVTMCHTLKNGYKGVKYDGVKFPKIGGGVYELDPRWNIGTDENPVPATNEYYLLYYSNGVLYAYNNTGTELQEVDISGNILNQCVNSKIVTGKTFKIGTDTASYSSSVTINGIEKSTPTILDWIRYDGAKIYRSSETASKNKIIVHWGYVKDKIPVEPDVETFQEYSTSGRTLQCHSLNALIHAMGTHPSRLPNMFPEGEGYYYCVYYTGRTTFRTVSGTNYPSMLCDTYGEYEEILPNNFTIDLNGCTLKLVNALEIKENQRVIYAPGTDGVTVKSGTIEGPYTVETLILTSLAGCYRGTDGIWEGASLVDACSTNYFTLDNVSIVGSYGYETSTSGVGLGSLVNINSFPIFYTSFAGSPNSYVKRIGASGNESIDKDSVIVYANKITKESLISPTHPDYDSSKPNRHVCLITTDYYDIPYDEVSGKLLLTYKPTNNLNPDWKNIDGKKYFTYECDEVFVHSYLKYSRGGVYPYFFVHFYSSTNEYIKTVKTGMYVAVKLPNGASKIRLTAYAICDVTTSGGSTTYDVLTVSDSNNPNNPVKYVSDVYAVTSDIKKRLGMARSKPTKNCTIRNCTYDRSRSCVLGNTGINYYVEGCTFTNIAATPRNLALTQMITDIEEHLAIANICCFKNCTAPRSEPRTACLGSCRNITCGYLRFLQMEGCNGLALNAGVGDGYIVDNVFDANCTIDQDSAVGNGHYRFIFKRNIVKDGFAILKNERNTKRKMCQSCFTPVPDVAVIEDCFVKRPSWVNSNPGVPVYYIGRSYKMFNYGAVDYIHDKYLSPVKELWAITEEMDAVEDGLVHFIVYADKPGAKIRVGTIKDYCELNASGKLLVYLDGVAMNGLFSDGYFIAPTSGLHLFTVKFNTKPFPAGSKMRVPDESIVAKFPSRVTSTFSISDKIPLNTAGSGKKAMIVFYKDIPTVLRSTDPFVPNITGNRLTRVFIPEGSKSNYTEFHYTEDNEDKYPWAAYTLHEEPLDLDKL